MKRNISTVLVSVLTALVLVPLVSLAASFFYVDSAGNVGIGNTDPQHRLDVSGAMYSRLITATSSTINWNLGNVQKFTLTSNQTLVFATGQAQAGGKYDLILVQDSTGGRTVTWPASVKWPGGNAPVLTSSANATDTVSFIYDGASFLGTYTLNYSAPHTYATWNSSDKSANITLSNGSLTANVSTDWAAVRSTTHPTTGKWYWEVHVDSTDTNRDMFIGLGNGSATLSGSNAANDSNTWVYYGNTGADYNGGGSAVYTGSTYTTGDIISVAYDADAGKIWFAKNGTWQNSGNPAAGTGYIWSGVSSGLYAFWDGNGNSPTQTVTVNFGQSAFSYAVPSGFNSGLYSN